MKTFLILLFAVSSFGQSIQEQVKTFDKPKSYAVKYDKFQKETTVTTSHLVKSSKNRTYMHMLASVSIPDKGEASFYFLFQSPRRDKLFSRDVLRIMTDDEILNLGESDIGYSTVFHIPEFPKIVQSKSVEFQLAGFEGKLDDKTLTTLRNLYSLTK